MNYTSPTAWGPEIILLTGDLWIPKTCEALPKKFAELLRSGKITSVICPGNLTNEDTYDWLRTLSTDCTIVKGAGDEFEKVTADYLVKEIGNVKIGVVNGHQLPSLSKEDITGYQEVFKDCAVIVYGSTNESLFELDKDEGRLYINPGSATGIANKDGAPTTPSFCLLCPTVDSSESNKITSFVCYRYELVNDEVKVKKDIVLTTNFKGN